MSYWTTINSGRTMFSTVLVLTKNSSVVGVASLLVVSFCRFSLLNYSVILFLVFVLVLFCLFLLFVVLPVASPPGRVHESDARGGARQ